MVVSEADLSTEVTQGWAGAHGEASTKRPPQPKPAWAKAEGRADPSFSDTHGPAMPGETGWRQGWSPAPNLAIFLHLGLSSQPLGLLGTGRELWSWAATKSPHLRPEVKGDMSGGKHICSALLADWQRSPAAVRGLPPQHIKAAQRLPSQDNILPNLDSSQCRGS